jgi:hypothetical protein
MRWTSLCIVITTLKTRTAARGREHCGCQISGKNKSWSILDMFQQRPDSPATHDLIVLVSLITFRCTNVTKIVGEAADTSQPSGCSHQTRCGVQDQGPDKRFKVTRNSLCAAGGVAPLLILVCKLLSSAERLTTSTPG